MIISQIRILVTLGKEKKVFNWIKRDEDRYHISLKTFLGNSFEFATKPFGVDPITLCKLFLINYKQEYL